MLVQGGQAADDGRVRPKYVVETIGERRVEQLKDFEEEVRRWRSLSHYCESEGGKVVGGFFFFGRGVEEEVRR